MLGTQRRCAIPACSTAAATATCSTTAMATAGPDLESRSLTSVTRLDCKRDADWLVQTCAALRSSGCCIVEHVIDEDLLAEIRPAMYRAQRTIYEEVGGSRLESAGELGVLRLMMKFEPLFF